MKSAHRHELQTNALAHRLEGAVDRLRPYVPTLAWGVVAIAVAAIIWSYMSRASASRQGDAWSAYNQAIGATMPDLNELHESAQEYPGTKMQELAELTWADGQVFNASQAYFYNRRASTEALNRALSAYQGILQTSDDERLQDRARLGLARIYEMRNELEKARNEYLAIHGGYATYAKGQAERLAKPEAKDIYAWLEKAQAPRVAPPTGPGIPGQRPEFDANDLSLPDTTQAPGAPGAVEQETSIEDLLKRLEGSPTQPGENAGEQSPPGTPQLPGTPSATPGAEGTPPASEGAAPPASGGSSTESDSPPPADSNSTPPATEASATEVKSAK